MAEIGIRIRMTKRRTDPDARDSRLMSRILRHCPERYGVALDHEGWASVEELGRGSGLPVERIIRIAETNTRYELSPDGRRIRALHGHSVDVGYGEHVSPPDVLYHGTSRENLEAIMASGAILPMRRTMVHLSVSPERAEEVGRRHGEPVVISVDSGRMVEDGFEFFLSGDGVYLTGRVPTGYFLDVTGTERRSQGPLDPVDLLVLLKDLAVLAHLAADDEIGGLQMIGRPLPVGGDGVVSRDVLPRLEIGVGHAQLDEPATDPGGRGVVRAEPVELALLDAALLTQKHDGIRYVPFR